MRRLKRAMSLKHAQGQSLKKNLVTLQHQKHTRLAHSKLERAGNIQSRRYT